MRRINSHLLWRWTGILSLLSLLLFAAGFVLALNPPALRGGVMQPPAPQPAQPAPVDDGVMRMVALGDSLTRGAGDGEGLGYVGRVRQALEQQSGRRITLNNLAVNGQESSGLLRQLKQTQVQSLIAQADAIVFTIGGNDLFRQSGGVYELDEERATAAVKALSVRFETIIQQLRSLNPTAAIVYVSLYNPFGDTDAAEETAVHILEWNSRAAAIAARHQGVFAVPTYDLFVGREKTYLYNDHYHPNRDGYARIAQRVVQILSK